MKTKHRTVKDDRFPATLCNLCLRRRPLDSPCGYFGAACKVPATVVKDPGDERRLERSSRKLAVEMGIRAPGLA
jgi:hypothetical protein